MLKKFTSFVIVYFIQSHAVSAQSNEPPSSLIQPFEATYNVLHKHEKVGEGVRTLEILPNGLTRYSYHTDIEWLIFSDTRSETSTINWQGNKVEPTHYKYMRKGTGRDKDYEWTYSTSDNKATNVKTKTDINVDFPENIQDKLSYHFQHRLNMLNNPNQDQYTYPVISTSGSIKNYTYEYDGEEELMLPYGLVKTIRLKREVVNKKRITYAWFAPELDYLMVKLYQTKGGAEQFEAQLKAHKYL